MAGFRGGLGATLASVHLLTLGILATTAIGASVQLLPVATRRTLRAVWALHELSLDYVAHPILPRTGETKTPEFTRINPRQKIPVLQDGDFQLAQSRRNGPSRRASSRRRRIKHPRRRK